RATMTLPDQTAATYAYDAANQLTSIAQGPMTVGFDYDNAGLRTRHTLPNGVAAEYSYDAAARLTGLTYKSGAGVIGRLTYAYDQASRPVTLGGAWSRTGQPSAVASATYNAAN